MTDTTKAQILDLARKAINTEMLALKHMKETLGDNFCLLYTSPSPRD